MRGNPDFSNVNTLPCMKVYTYMRSSGATITEVLAMPVQSVCPIGSNLTHLHNTPHTAAGLFTKLRMTPSRQLAICDISQAKKLILQIFQRSLPEQPGGIISPSFTWKKRTLQKMQYLPTNRKYIMYIQLLRAVIKKLLVHSSGNMCVTVYRLVSRQCKTNYVHLNLNQWLQFQNLGQIKQKKIYSINFLIISLKFRQWNNTQVLTSNYQHFTEMRSFIPLDIVAHYLSDDLASNLHGIILSTLNLTKANNHIRIKWPCRHNSNKHTEGIKLS